MHLHSLCSTLILQEALVQLEIQYRMHPLSLDTVSFYDFHMPPLQLQLTPLKLSLVLDSFYSL